MSDSLHGVTEDLYHLPCAVADHSDTDKHLPECELATGVYDDRADCICDALRACELRVRTEPFDVAYLAGLDAAIRALADMPSGHLRGREIVILVDAVAAIRELSRTRTENGTVVTHDLRIETLRHEA